MVSRTCSESGLMEKYSRVRQISIGAEIEDRAIPEVGALVGATQGGVGRNIFWITQPTRRGLSGATRLLGGLKNQAAAKFGAKSAHRWVAAPKADRGLVSIMGPGGFSMRTLSRRSATSLRGRTGIGLRAPFIGGNCHSSVTKSFLIAVSRRRAFPGEWGFRRKFLRIYMFGNDNWILI